MIHKERITYGPYLNETYYKNMIKTNGEELVLYLSEGISIIYDGNVFNLEEYWSYDVDDKGNPIT